MRSSKPSIAELRAVCQPPEHLARYSAEHWAGRLYGRAVSIRVTWVLVRTGLSANAITVLMALIGFAGALAFSIPALWGAIVGALAIQVYLILDCSDGEVARWRDTTGATGIFLDRLGHYMVEATLFAAMGWRVANNVNLDPSITPRLGHESAAVGDEVFLTYGLIAALIHLFGKVQTDLVHVARTKAGLTKVEDSAEAAAPRASGLAALRRLAGRLPIYRLVGAIEASMVALVLVVADTLTDSITYSKAFVIGALIVTSLVAVGHLLMILASSRLK